MGLKLDGFHWHNYNILIALWPVGSTSLEPTRLYMQRVDVRRSSILNNVQDYCVYIGWFIEMTFTTADSVAHRE